jgi:hypothetical protein
MHQAAQKEGNPVQIAPEATAAKTRLRGTNNHKSLGGGPKEAAHQNPGTTKTAAHNKNRVQKNCPTQRSDRKKTRNDCPETFPVPRGSRILYTQGKKSSLERKPTEQVPIPQFFPCPP